MVQTLNEVIEFGFRIHFDFFAVPSITDQIERFDFQQLCIVVAGVVGGGGGGGGSGCGAIVIDFFFFFLFLIRLVWCFPFDYKNGTHTSVYLV